MLETLKNLTIRTMGSVADKTDKTKTMKAVRFHGQRDLRLEDIPEPQVGKGQIKVSRPFC